MTQRTEHDAAASILALLMLAGLVVGALHWWGFDTGIPRWLVCTAGNSLVLGLGPGSLQIAVAVGLLLAIFRPTRGTGIALLIAAVLAIYGLELWLQQTQSYCSFTP